MIVDPDVVLARPGGLVGRAGDHERGGLPAADVAALALGRPERGEEPVDERDGRRLPRLEHRRPDRRPLHHVRLDRDAVRGHVARRGDARSAGPRRGSAVRVDDPDLADRPARIGLEERGEGVGRRPPLRSRASPFGPWAISVNDWVETAPTPDSTHGQVEPTNGQAVWMATPKRPLAGSRATIE